MGDTLRITASINPNLADAELGFSTGLWFVRQTPMWILKGKRGVCDANIFQTEVPFVLILFRSLIIQLDHI